VLSVQAPTAVSLPGAQPAAVAAGNAHTCALDGATGGVTCFGANDTSQLTGPPTARGEVAVQLPEAARAVTAGYDHACALLAGGGIQCWGANGRGQLGLGVPSASSQSPAFVSGR
jgi:alpha-tubulin suppressor-like RCC1 family protein